MYDLLEPRNEYKVEKYTLCESYLSGKIFYWIFVWSNIYILTVFLGAIYRWKHTFSGNAFYISLDDFK